MAGVLESILEAQRRGTADVASVIEMMRHGTTSREPSLHGARQPPASARGERRPGPRAPGRPCARVPRGRSYRSGNSILCTRDRRPRRRQRRHERDLAVAGNRTDQGLPRGRRPRAGRRPLCPPHGRLCEAERRRHRPGHGSVDRPRLIRRAGKGCTVTSYPGRHALPSRRRPVPRTCTQGRCSEAKGRPGRISRPARTARESKPMPIDRDRRTGRCARPRACATPGPPADDRRRTAR
jgi:hypothetical protein